MTYFKTLRLFLKLELLQLLIFVLQIPNFLQRSGTGSVTPAVLGDFHLSNKS